MDRRSGEGRSRCRLGWLLGTFCLTLAPAVVIASAGAEHGEAAPHFDKAMVFQIINFFLLIALLLFVYRKYAAGDGGFKKRSADIQMAMEEAAREKQKAEEKYKEYQARIATLDDELKKILERAAEDAAGEREALLAEAQAQAKKFAKQAEFTSRQEIEQARRELRKEAADLAAGMAETLLRKAITQQDQRDWVRSYTEKIGELS
ncbi:MAG: ATP synthase F0 subunit B [bacterium]